MIPVKKLVFPQTNKRHFNKKKYISWLKNRKTKKKEFSGFIVVPNNYLRPILFFFAFNKILVPALCASIQTSAIVIIKCTCEGKIFFIQAKNII